MQNAKIDHSIHKHTIPHFLLSVRFSGPEMFANCRKIYVHSLNLGFVVALDILRAEILKAHGGRQSSTNRVQVGSESDGLQRINKIHVDKLTKNKNDR